MAYTAWSVSFGEQPSAAKWNILGTNDAYFDSLIGSGTAWTSYSPTWTTSGTAPAIGNGSLTGAYQQLGKTVFFRIRFTAGSTTTYGTQAWQFGLPVAAHSYYTTASTNQSFPGAGYMENSGVLGYNAVGAFMNATLGASKFAITVVASAASAVDLVSSSVPFTWGTADYISFGGTYQAA